jgi:lysozyme
MRHITEDGLRLIRRFEGFSAIPYLCPAGYLTVGYGHVVKNPAAFRQPITEDEATEILVLDVAKAEKAVLRLITVPLSDGQFDALVSFTFNLGSGALQRSTLRRKVNREDHAEVPAEFLRWVWAGGKKLKGLIRRREAEAALYQT